MTSDGEVLLHGYAVKCDVAPSKKIRNPNVLSPIFVDPWSKKIRSPNSSALNPLTRDLPGLGFVELQNGHVHSTAGKGHKPFSRNVQVSCPLLEPRGGHVVVLHVKVLKFRSSDNLFMMLRRASPCGFLPKIETSCDRSREFPDTFCSSVADGSRQTGGPFLLRNCAGTLRSAADSRFTRSSLDAGCTRGLSSSSSELAVRSGQTRGLLSSFIFVQFSCVSWIC